MRLERVPDLYLLFTIATTVQSHLPDQRITVQSPARRQRRHRRHLQSLSLKRSSGGWTDRSRSFSSVTSEFGHVIIVSTLIYIQSRAGHAAVQWSGEVNSHQLSSTSQWLKLSGIRSDTTVLLLLGPSDE